MALITRSAVPGLGRVTVCAALVVPTSRLPKSRLLVGVKLTAGATPVPLRLIACGLPVALSVMPMDALRVPVAVGAKVTLKSQVALGASVVTQLAGTVVKA